MTNSIDALIGTTLAGYRIVGLIGRGGMGVVYRAESPAGSTVALKLMAPEFALDDAFRQRFLRESQLVIPHDHIVPILDAGEAEGRLYIAMHLVQGCDLKTVIRTEGRLLPARVSAIFGQAAEALDAAHAYGMVHRDIKPQNFLIEQRPEAPEKVYLSDFGLVKYASSDTSLTGSAHLVGTAHYMSPEQIKGQDLDGRADVYSLGCVLHEALTGSVPYPLKEEVAVLWAHMHDPAPRVTEKVPVLPDGLDDVVATAMAKEPDDRYLTASDLSADLRSALGSEDGARSRRVVDISSPSSRRARPPIPSGTTPSPPPPQGASFAGWVVAAAVAVVAVLAGLRSSGTDLPGIDTLPALLGTQDEVASDDSSADEQRASGRNPLKRQVSRGGARRDRGRKGSGFSRRSTPVQNVVAGLAPHSRPAAGGDAASTPPHPAPGDYSYRQSGQERSCMNAGGGCSGADLPDRASIHVSRWGLSSSPVVSLTIESSPTFSMVMRMRFFDRRVDLEELTVDVEAAAGTPRAAAFNIRLEPDPVLPWLVLPLSSGRQWSGAWQSEPPGSYSIRVLGPDRVAVGNRVIRTIRIRAELTWEGQHAGYYNVTSWVDPRTRLALAAVGELRARTGIQESIYDATFRTALLRGPGYEGGQ